MSYGWEYVNTHTHTHTNPIFSKLQSTTSSTYKQGSRSNKVQTKTKSLVTKYQKEPHYIIICYFHYYLTVSFNDILFSSCSCLIDTVVSIVINNSNNWKTTKVMIHNSPKEIFESSAQMTGSLGKRKSPFFNSILIPTIQCQMATTKQQLHAYNLWDVSQGGW